jgi:hypothetical protein
VGHLISSSLFTPCYPQIPTTPWIETLHHALRCPTSSPCVSTAGTGGAPPESLLHHHPRMRIFTTLPPSGSATDTPPPLDGPQPANLATPPPPPALDAHLHRVPGIHAPAAPVVSLTAEDHVRARSPAVRRRRADPRRRRTRRRRPLDLRCRIPLPPGVCPSRCLKGAPHALPSSPVDGTSPLAIGFLFFSLQLFSGYDNIEQFVCYNLFCSIAFVNFISTSRSLLHTNILIATLVLWFRYNILFCCYNLFGENPLKLGFATFVIGVCYNSIFFCYKFSGEVSGESPTMLVLLL